MILTRRSAIKLGVGMSALAFGGRAFSQMDGNLPSPDFSFDERETRFLAGLRPFRDGSYRLEAESLDDRLIVHNYGHGGAGITMSWGCAYEVLDAVRDAAKMRGNTPVAVLGAGAMGLTAATLLLDAGYRVTVYAKGYCEETTSHIAGGQFAPSVFNYEDSPSGIDKLQRILRRSFRAHEARIGQGFGVSRKRNYTTKLSGSFDLVPRDVIPEPTFLPKYPFENHHSSGYCYQTLLIEPPIFLRKLELDLRVRGVWLRRYDFSAAEEVYALNEKIIVNCTGLGAGKLFQDAQVIPIRGQIALLKPQPRLDYLYQGFGYIFPRADGVVVGGSYEKGVSDPKPDPVMCHTILNYARAGFAGDQKGLIERPSWLESEV